jgi:predicted DNA-binding transcriptional regulator AlpA
MAMKLIDSKEAADLLGCTEAALGLWRKEGRGPSYIRVERLVKYREADLIAWIESRRVQPKPIVSQ